MRLSSKRYIHIELLTREISQTTLYATRTSYQHFMSGIMSSVRFVIYSRTAAMYNHIVHAYIVLVDASILSSGPKKENKSAPRSYSYDYTVSSSHQEKIPCTAALLHFGIIYAQRIYTYIFISY